jgi:chromosome segregation protein
MTRSDELSAVQGRYYQAGADATRTEQALQHARELRQRQRADLERVKAEHSESSVLVGRDREQLAELTRYLEQAEPELDAARASEEAARTALAEAEAATAAWQLLWEAFSRESAEATRAAQVEQARIEQIDAGLQRLRAQRQRLVEERNQLENSFAGARPEEFAAAEEKAREQGRQAQQELDGALATLQSLREREREGIVARGVGKGRAAGRAKRMPYRRSGTEGCAWQRPRRDG